MVWLVECKRPLACADFDEKAEIVVFEKGEYVSFASCGLPCTPAG